jgi:hypothetical protein
MPPALRCRHWHGRSSHGNNRRRLPRWVSNAQVNKQEQQQRTAFSIRNTREFLDGDVSEQHYEPAGIDGRADNFINAGPIRYRVDGIRVENYAAHEPTLAAP